MKQVTCLVSPASRIFPSCVKFADGNKTRTAWVFFCKMCEIS